MEEKIRTYIVEIAKKVQGSSNVFDFANSIFGSNPLVKGEAELVVPELAEIQSVKRNTVIAIIKEKTGYKVAPAPDMLGEGGEMILIDKPATGAAR